MSFFKVKVQFEVDNGKRTKSVNRMFIVEAVSPTEAEIKMTTYLNKSASAIVPEDYTGAFEVKDCVCTKYEDYIE